MRKHQRVKCTAKNKDGTPCKAWAIDGTERCRMHSIGRKTRFAPGPLNPNYKHGRYAKVLPVRLLDSYHTAIADPELMNQRDEIAILTARLQELLKRVDTGESGRIWKALGDTVDEMIAAKKAGDSQGMGLALNQIVELTQAGHADSANWNEIQALMLDRNKVVASERKRIIEAKLFLTAEQGLNLMVHVANAINDSLQRRIPDKSLRDAIVQDVAAAAERLWTRPN